MPSGSLVLLPILFVARMAATDLTGAWTFEWNPDFGGERPNTHECQIAQQGEALTIRCNGQEMKGKVRDKTVTFEHTTGSKNEITATYKVTVDEKGTSMRGSWHLSAGEHRDGKFQARKHRPRALLQRRDPPRALSVPDRERAFVWLTVRASRSARSPS